MFVHLATQKGKNATPLLTRKSSMSYKTNNCFSNILSLQSSLGNQAVQRLIKSGVLQTKLTLGKPNDIYEHEAEGVADQVMQMPALSKAHSKGASDYNEVPSVQRMCTECEEKLGRQTEDSGLGYTTEERLHKLTEGVQVRRMCSECEEELHRQPMDGGEEAPHTEEVPGGTSQASPSIEAQINSIRDGGQPLPESVRAFFEPRFGYELSGVRIHTDARAAESAVGVNALAYTLGGNIVFGPGQYTPNTRRGRRVIAHELAHVIQQSNGLIDRLGQQPLIQRQFGESPFGPPLPDFPEPDIDCSINLAANKLQEFINCCAKTPLGRGCSKDVIEAICKLPGVDCGGKKDKGEEVSCPPGFKAGATRDFKGQCCKEGIVAENASVCCPPGRIAINAINPRCCPEGTTPDGERKTCITPPTPLPLCPSGQVTLRGECCFPPLISNGFSCVLPPSPPPKPPVPPTPLPSSLEIFFRRDKPSPGAAGSKALNDSLTGEGRKNFNEVVRQLQENPALKVQLVGRTSPEGAEGYNLALGKRRAEMIAEALQREGIDSSKIDNPPVHELRSECQEVQPGIFTCGEAGATGPNDRQVLARLFIPNQ